jgi:hypothetical protein
MWTRKTPEVGGEEQERLVKITEDQHDLRMA